MNRRYLAPLLVTVALLTTSGAAVAVDVINKPGSCQRDAAQSPVIAEFTISGGGAMTERLPRSGKAPELEAMTGPLQVVVFAEHHGVPVFGQLRADPSVEPTTFKNVVCVVTPSSDEWYYCDIPLDGLN